MAIMIKPKLNLKNCVPTVSRPKINANAIKTPKTTTSTVRNFRKPNDTDFMIPTSPLKELTNI
jgi:hypothetical protein